MNKLLMMGTLGVFLLSGCAQVAPGKYKSAPPGQVQKATGYNPASGKMKK